MPNPERVAAEMVLSKCAERYVSPLPWVSKPLPTPQAVVEEQINIAERIIREAYAGEAKPTCPTCGATVTWQQGDKRAYCDVLHMFPVESAEDFAQFFRGASPSDDLVKVRGAIQSSLTLLRMIRDKRTEDWVGILNLTDEHGAALAVKAWDDLKAAERILKTLK